MEIDVLIGAPDPGAVDTSEVAKQLPYGTVRVEVTKGGLAISPDEGSDAIVIANAGVKAFTPAFAITMASDPSSGEIASPPFVTSTRTVP